MLASAPAARATGPVGLGEPQEDLGGLIGLPRGFRYRVVQAEARAGSRTGRRCRATSTGWRPSADRAAARRCSCATVSSRAAATPRRRPVEGRGPYRAEAIGGATATIVDRAGRAQESHVTSSGTLQNCAGGATPWGTWITCEETREAGHGFCFEVDPREPESNLSRTPITGMGFFSHEAIDIDPRTGIAYLTEDDFQGEIPDDVVGEGPESRVSFLYRYLPTNRAQRPGALQEEGGRLQVMTLDFLPSFNVDLAFEEDRFGVVWRDVDPADPRAGALSAGAARFQRLEGSHFAGGAFWFDDTAGGEKRNGQVFRLLPSGDPAGGGRDRLELFLESESTEELDSPDNLVVTPWGDVWLAEDGDGIQRVLGITRPHLLTRRAHLLPQRPVPRSHVRHHRPLPDAGRRREMGVRAPSHPYAPRISPELRERAQGLGITPFAAAAARRLGYDLD